MSALQTFTRELRALDVGPKALRSFGRVVGAVVLAIALLTWWRQAWVLGTTATVLFTVGGLLVVFGQFAPTVLRPFYRVWMGLALILGDFMSLGLLFFLVVTPLGILRRTFSKSAILTKPDPSLASYWMPKEPSDLPDRQRLEKYY